MLRLVEQMKTSAVKLDAQADSLSANAAQIAQRLKGYAVWAERAKAEAQSRHEAVVAALEEENKAIQSEFATMLTDLSEMLSDIEGAEKGNPNG